MANYKTGAQRYNDKMDKIFARSKELNEKYHGKDSFGSEKEKKTHSMPQYKKIDKIAEKDSIESTSSKLVKKMASKMSPEASKGKKNYGK